ncbi:hypothetical protein EVB74_060 [Rhizobium phage RHph_Y3_56_1]|nr:hypothetical protein EVB59_061 [Rhizobium phage RHph_Y3_1]QIG78008.1 hypothetical protein EVB74_060 [Rhizobium phage RHph_Y3_56_1]
MSVEDVVRAIDLVRPGRRADLRRRPPPAADRPRCAPHVAAAGVGHSRQVVGLVFRDRADIRCPSSLDADSAGSNRNRVARVVGRAEFVNAALLRTGRKVEIAMTDVRCAVDALDIADMQAAVLDAHGRRDAFFAAGKADHAEEGIGVRQSDRQACRNNSLRVREVADIACHRVVDQHIDVLAQRVAEIGLCADQIDIRPDRQRLPEINARIVAEGQDGQFRAPCGCAAAEGRCAPQDQIILQRPIE